MIAVVAGHGEAGRGSCGVSAWKRTSRQSACVNCPAAGKCGSKILHAARRRRQLRDRNIAEGFGRYRHKEFAHYLNIARGSVFEVIDLLRDGVSRRYWSEHSVQEHQSLCNRTIAALTGFIRWLRTHPDPSP
ncbi:MAG TPA: four helix bundle protein [Vicinamibacterales bacterium]|nr:four helix bundle protein [Vicinamibacterales bacterium]